MKVVEFQLPLPLRFEDYQCAQLHGVARKMLEDGLEQLRVGGDDMSEVLVSEPYSENGAEGNFTHKRMSIAGKLPGWLVAIVGADTLRFEEMSWNGYPRFLTRYSSEGVSNFTFEVKTNHVVGLPESGNHCDLPEDQLALRKIVSIDIVNDPVLKSAPAYENLQRNFQCKRRGWKSLSADWLHSQQYPVLTAYKTFIVDLRFLGYLANRVESFVVSFLTDLLRQFHRNMVAKMDSWDGLGLPELRQLEAFSKRGLDQIAPLILAKKKQPMSHLLVEFDTMSSRLQAPAEVSPEMRSRKDQETLSEAMEFVQSCLRDFAGQAQADVGLKDDAVSPSFEGFLYKKSGGGIFGYPVWNLRYVSLKGNVMSIYLNQQAQEARHVVDMTAAKVQFTNNPNDLVERTHGIVITCPDQRIVLSATAEESSRTWTIKLQMSCEDRVVQASSGVVDDFPEAFVREAAMDSRAIHALSHLRRSCLTGPKAMLFTTSYQSILFGIENPYLWLLPCVPPYARSRWLRRYRVPLLIMLSLSLLVSVSVKLLGMTYLIIATYMTVSLSKYLRTWTSCNDYFVSHWIPAFNPVHLSGDGVERTEPQEVAASMVIDAPVDEVILSLLDPTKVVEWTKAKARRFLRDTHSPDARGALLPAEGFDRSDLLRGGDYLELDMDPRGMCTAGYQSGLWDPRLLFANCRRRLWMTRRIWTRISDRAFVLLTFTVHLNSPEGLGGCLSREGYDVFYLCRYRSRRTFLHRLSGVEWGGRMWQELQQHLTLAMVTASLQDLGLLHKIYGSLDNFANPMKF
ncbi:MAG: uncharacterized protein KVP18_003820 [Porospora cf. gigantea A]|uniref:uncharacterized protein n=1 Tax=Porospora cf. gigantea A TaxID=2853593 RepID=UPI00355A1BAA|nr:MAG: hypothetical protein KVP18_003820 [Porospora cf. gigantea A]